ncbi:MAG: 50S ribosomal protein L13 [Myxococcales bacterium]|nr:50S ribosomal protein L13 [Myxococcales bacterium]MCC6524520.1 50S ribosomal protein L13 [Polyangiaceae bacterium]
MNPHRKTYVANPADAQSKRGWWVVDASAKPLGRLASIIATKLRGKDKTTFTPHVDTGDFVVVVNASKVELTGNKADAVRFYRHSGFLGGIKERTLVQTVARHPELPITKAVWGMLPKGPLGRKLIKKLKVYAGPDHPHAAQEPKALEV